MFHGLASFVPLSGAAGDARLPVSAIARHDEQDSKAAPGRVALRSGDAPVSTLEDERVNRSKVSVEKAEKPDAPAATGLVSRVRNRLFPARAAAVALVPAEAKKRGIGFQASIAELLLINRLKALGRRDQSAEVMERASHIVFVTCQNWFTEPEAKAKSQQPHKVRL